MQTTKEQAAAGLAVIMAVAETIRELGECPSGPLYARLMGRVSFESYQSIIRTLKGANLVTERNSMLTWIGPKVGA